MYKSDGTLVPIEINTNIIMDSVIPDNLDIIFDLTPLSNFITTNGFTKLIYIGSLSSVFQTKITEMCQSLNITYEWIEVEQNSITIPYVEDNPETLIMRSAYDTTAIVDDVYCKNKVNFLNLIKNQTFGSQFAYMNEFGMLINHITTIPNNGNHPNFILKSVLPKYDKGIYPKLYKVSNQAELDIVLQNVNENYYLTEFFYNPNKLILDHITVIRTFNLLYPPSLISLPIGQYHKITGEVIDELSTYDPTTYELFYDDRFKYITKGANLNTPKLLDTDKVEMADGTFKTALELEIGDYVKTLDVANPQGIDIAKKFSQYLVDYDVFLSGTTYTTNKILRKAKIDQLVNYAKIEFTDGTHWEDTVSSNYLINRNNEVRFIGIDELLQNDQVILIDSSKEVFTCDLKTVVNVSVITTIFSGWAITIETNHIFLTQNEENTSYVAIEHNIGCIPDKTGLCSYAWCYGGYYCDIWGVTSCWCRRA